MAYAAGLHAANQSTPCIYSVIKSAFCFKGMLEHATAATSQALPEPHLTSFITALTYLWLYTSNSRRSLMQRRGVTCGPAR